MFLIIFKFAAFVVLILSIGVSRGEVYQNLWWFICGVAFFAGSGAQNAEMDGPYNTSLRYWYRWFYVGAILYNPFVKVLSESLWLFMHLGMAVSLVYSVFKIDLPTLGFCVDGKLYKEFFSPIKGEKYGLYEDDAADFLKDRRGSKDRRLRLYSEITPAAAALLSVYSGDLDLSGVTSINDAVAAALSDHKYEVKFNEELKCYIRSMGGNSRLPGFTRLASKIDTQISYMNTLHRTEPFL